MTHTPGPWIKDGLSVIVKQRGTICKCPTVPNRGVFDVEANARLIAAAPEMYAELKKIEWKYMGTLEDDTDYIICPDCENERAEGHKKDCGLEQAIARAEDGDA